MVPSTFFKSVDQVGNIMSYIFMLSGVGKLVGPAESTFTVAMLAIDSAERPSPSSVLLPCKLYTAVTPADIFLPRAVLISDRTLANDNLATVTTNECPEPGSINEMVRLDDDANNIGDGE